MLWILFVRERKQTWSFWWWRRGRGTTATGCGEFAWWWWAVALGSFNWLCLRTKLEHACRHIDSSYVICFLKQNKMSIHSVSDLACVICLFTTPEQSWSLKIIQTFFYERNLLDRLTRIKYTVAEVLNKPCEGDIVGTALIRRLTKILK